MGEKIKEAIETVIDARDVCENGGSAYFYKFNGGLDRLNNIIECLRMLEDIVHEKKIIADGK